MGIKLLFAVLVCLMFSGCEFIFQNRSMHQPVCMEPIKKEVNEKVWIEAKTNKIWVGPHVDENGDLIDGHYKYVVITPGHWAVKGKNENE